MSHLVELPATAPYARQWLNPEAIVQVVEHCVFNEATGERSDQNVHITFVNGGDVWLPLSAEQLGLGL